MGGGLTLHRIAKHASSTEWVNWYESNVHMMNFTVLLNYLLIYVNK